MDPITISLIAQGALGAFQLGKGLIDSKKAKRPGLDLLYQNLKDRENIYKQSQRQYADAKERARFGYDQNTMAGMIGGVEDSYKLGLSNMLNSGMTRGQFFANQGGLGAIRARSMNDAYAKDFQQKLNNIMYADQRSDYSQQKLADIGQARTNIYGEQLREFQDKAGAARALIGSGIQNLAGGLQQWGNAKMWQGMMSKQGAGTSFGAGTTNIPTPNNPSIMGAAQSFFGGLQQPTGFNLTQLQELDGAGNSNAISPDMYQNAASQLGVGTGISGRADIGGSSGFPYVFFPPAGGGRYEPEMDPNVIGNMENILKMFQSKKKGGKIKGKIGSWSSMIPAYMFQKMEAGGLVPVNIEQNEILADPDGEILDVYEEAPPHPKKGKDPKGNRMVPEGSYVVPKRLMDKFINGTKSERKKILKSLPQ